MAIPSKEENVLRLLLENSPLKQWHFEEIVKKAKVTKTVANKWLKKYLKEGLLQKVKEKGKFPYFMVGSNNLIYNSKKRIYALEQLYKSGLISKLSSIKSADTVIIFGSFARGDWYKDSDIDIFVYGNIDDFDKNNYESKLKKHIELHVFENKEEIKQIKTGLINNVINGYVVKGRIQDIAEVA